MGIAVCPVLLSSSCPAQGTDPCRAGSAFRLLFRDSIPMEVSLVPDRDGLPDLYLCHVNTPVCDDGLCRSLILDVYWDVLGNFSHFKVPEYPPMTKWDHLEFTRDDYLKLSEILKDKESVLGSVKDVNALFHPSTKKISEKVDALTGATLETIRSAVVEGAVYSSYTLWHVVNGDIPPAIRRHTLSCLGPALIRKFLQSENYHYHYEALGYLVSNGYKGHFPDLVRMLEKGSPFVSRRAVVQFPEAWIEEEHFQSAITGMMAQLDYLAQEIWLDRLMEIRVYGSTLDQLTTDPGRFSQRQLLQVLAVCEKNRSMLSDDSLNRLGSLLQHENERIAAGTCRIFEKLSPENKHANKILKHHEKKQGT